jgi:hypothetical protein
VKAHDSPASTLPSVSVSPDTYFVGAHLSSVRPSALSTLTGRFPVVVTV